MVNSPKLQTSFNKTTTGQQSKAVRRFQSYMAYKISILENKEMKVFNDRHQQQLQKAIAKRD